nr:Uma2 family endonuclease [[Leptolyngbya] sp. PCC 7376]
MNISFPIELNLDSCDLSDEQFFQLCQCNEVWQFERSATNQLIIMPLADGETSNRNADVTYQLYIWAQKTKSAGITFGSSTGFTLPNRAVRSPDAAWIPIEKWQSLTQHEREKFPPLSLDFVVELLAVNEKLDVTQAKLREYIDTGTCLGWLINRKTQQVEVYRPNQEVEILNSPATLSGEDVLVGFELDLSTIW